MRSRVSFAFVLVLLTFVPAAGWASPSEAPVRSVAPLCPAAQEAVAPPAVIPPLLFLVSGFCQASYC